ncbi:MAG: hypothetical protein Q9170_004513 [Blastenia crenularia]
MALSSQPRQIERIADKAKLSQKSLDPNIILLHAGTNDLNMSPPIDPEHAPDRLGALIDQLILDSPDAAILVAQIIHAANAKTEALIQIYDVDIARVVVRRAKAGCKVFLVDMRSITAADLVDGLHPTDAGYQKMADLWFKAIQEVSHKGWIKAPITSNPRRLYPAPRTSLPPVSLLLAMAASLVLVRAAAVPRP